MANYNKTMLIGNLTRDPELRYTNNGTPVCDVGLAVNHQWRDADGEKREEATFVDVVLWGKLAELAEKYLAKGRSVFVEGRLQMESWEDKQTGQKRSRLRVVAEALQFLGAPPDREESPTTAGGGSGAGTAPTRDPGSRQRPGRIQQGQGYAARHAPSPAGDDASAVGADDDDIPF